MLYIILLLTVLIIYILIKEPKSLYSTIFSFELFAIILILFSNTLLTIRLYFISTFIVNKTEYNIYNTISQIPFTFADIKTLANVSVSIFFIASVMLISHDTYKNQNIRRAGIAAATALCLAMMFLNSPKFIERLWAMQYSGKSAAAEFIKLIINLINVLMLSAGIIACIKLFVQAHRSRILFKKNQLRLLLVFTLIINIIYISIIAFMPIKGMINNYDIYTVQTNAINNVTIIICIAILLTIMALFYNLLFSKKASLLEKAIFKQPKPLNHNCILPQENIRHVFHSYKNAFFSVKMLIQKASASYDRANFKEFLGEAEKQIDDMVRRTAKFLNLYNNPVPIEYDYINIYDCINAALNKNPVSDDIKIIKKFDAPSALLYGDYEAITEVLINLFSNASEAIAKKNIPDGTITVGTWFEYPWMCISIRDNGTGMTAKERKKIFEPLYSTKQTFNNWGVGLSYVKNIVSEHAGHVNVKSVPGKYSEFQVILPADDIDEVIDSDKSNDM